MNSVPKRMRAVQVVFFFALITIGKLTYYLQQLFAVLKIKCFQALH